MTQGSAADRPATMAPTATDTTRRQVLACGAAAVAALGLARPARAADSALAQRFATLYKAAAKEGSLVYYTDQRQETSQRLSAFWKQHFPDVRLMITPIGSPALVAQVETERAARQYRVDVTHMSQLYIAEIWKKKGYYQAYKTAGMARFRPEYADADGAWYSPELYVLPVGYNTKAFPDRKDLPRKLADFLDPKWKGKMVLPDPATSGNTLTFFTALLAKGMIDWKFMERLAQQDLLFVRGNPDAVRMVASGERALTPMLSTFNIMPAKRAGQPIDFYALDEGSLIVKSAMGIMAGTQHPNAGRLLMELMTSPEGQALLAEGGTFWPADKAVPLDKDLPPLASMRPIDPPPPGDADSVAAFMARFKSVFGRR